ncbi:MAG: sulfatase [Akkermansiaceae bacterium]|jgi:arylsulfatase A-like enzyme|nr:sulfatase [Akkermansiaceae bacterium]
MKRATLLALLLSSHFATAAKPVNILMLYADDWRHDVLGVAGHPVVKTPNLDKLSAEGVRFTHNCVTTSICGVSRASLYTGQWMSRHGNHGFNEWKTAWELSYPALLRQNGYHTGHVGKWHNGAPPEGKFDFGRFYMGKHWYPAPDGGKIHSTQRNENDALEFLRSRPKDKPFYLNVAFFTPHAEDSHPEQFLPQPETMALYQDVTIPVPANATDESWKRLPDFFTDMNEGRNRWRWRFDTPEKYQRMMKNYYRLVTGIDTTAGRILAELEKQGVLDHTLVIFTTDNGYFHGEHGLADKWYPHQESIRVPLIIRDPRMAAGKKGTTNDDFTLNVDLAPTILTAAGVAVPAVMQGRDIAPLYLATEKPEWRSEFFYEHPTIKRTAFIPASQALVRKDWKYFHWPEHNVDQLFDLTTDPREENDLAADPAQARRLAEMRRRFAELKAQAR